MDLKFKISIGDIVTVTFNNSHYKLGSYLEVLQIPNNEHRSMWCFFQDEDALAQTSKKVHWVNEPITVTKVIK